MLTYRENRMIFVEEGALQFPCHVEVTIVLGENSALGSAVEGATILHGSIVQLTWNANTGRASNSANTPFPEAHFEGDIGKMHFEFQDKTVEASWECHSREELMGYLGTLHFVLPLSLSLNFMDAFTVLTTSGKTEHCRFVWQVNGTQQKGDVISAEERDTRLKDGFRYLPTIVEPPNVRLLAATEYFHRAIRLIDVGDGPSEFASEAVVNLAKVLEALWPGDPSRDAIRAGLEGVGVDPSLIERVFIPCELLRSHLDAAHVGLAVLRFEERAKLQSFLESVLVHFRQLLRQLTEGVDSGEMAINPYVSERRDNDDIQKFFSQLP